MIYRSPFPDAMQKCSGVGAVSGNLHFAAPVPQTNSAIIISGRKLEGLRGRNYVCPYARFFSNFGEKEKKLLELGFIIQEFHFFLGGGGGANF